MMNQSAVAGSRKMTIFAESIRQRNRELIRKEIRSVFEEQCQLRDLFRGLPDTLEDLYQICKKSKAGEYAVAQQMVTYIVEANPPLQINSMRSIIYWSYLLSLTFEYHPEQIQVILKKVGIKIIQQCEQSDNLQIMFILLNTALKNLATFFQEKASNFLEPYIIRTNKLLFDRVNTSQQIEKESISYDGLCFLRSVFYKFPDKMLELVSSTKFLIFLCLQIDKLISSMQCIEEIIKILVIITFNDGELYQNITNTLLRGKIIQYNQYQAIEGELINRLKFILDFLNIKSSQSLPRNISALIGNIIENDPEIIQEIMSNGMHELLYFNSFDDTSVEESQEKEQRICEKVNKVAFDWNERVEFAKAYLVIASSMIYQKRIVEEVREKDVVEKIVHIIDVMGERETQILDIGRHAIIRILQIGEQIMNYDSSKINPYALKLYHLQAGRILTKFQQHFDDILDRYNM